MTEPRAISLCAPRDLPDWRVEALLADAYTPTLTSMRMLEPGDSHTFTEFMPTHGAASLLPLPGPNQTPDHRHPGTWRLVDRTPITAAYEPHDPQHPATGESLRFELLPTGVRVDLVEPRAHSGAMGLRFAFPRTLFAADDALTVHIGGRQLPLDSTGPVDPVPATVAELVWTTSDRALRLHAHPADAAGVSWTLHRPAVPGRPGVAASHIELWLRWTDHPDDTNVAANSHTIRRGCTLSPRHGA